MKVKDKVLVEGFVDLEPIYDEDLGEDLIRVCFESPYKAPNGIMCVMVPARLVKLKE
jgi:hypothetical protein